MHELPAEGAAAGRGAGWDAAEVSVYPGWSPEHTGAEHHDDDDHHHDYDHAHHQQQQHHHDHHEGGLHPLERMEEARAHSIIVEQVRSERHRLSLRLRCRSANG